MHSVQSTGPITSDLGKYLRKYGCKVLIQKECGLGLRKDGEMMVLKCLCMFFIANFASAAWQGYTAIHFLLLLQRILNFPLFDLLIGSLLRCLSFTVCKRVIRIHY